MCDRLRTQVGDARMSELLRWSAKPCETWSVDFHHMADEWNVTRQQELVDEWWQYMREQAPYGAKIADVVSEYTLKEVAHVAGPSSALGFAKVTKASLNSDCLHGPHREYRNEWWTLQGKIESELWTQPKLMTWRVWRRTVLPPPLWHDKPDTYFSEIKLTVTIDGVVTLNTEWWPEAWNVFTLGNGAFDLQCQEATHQFAVSTVNQSLALFPMHFKSLVNESVLLNLVELTNHKPLVKFRSNGTAFATDGLGVKHYYYPVVSGAGTWGTQKVEFTGQWTHAWSSGLLPAGYASSFVGRFWGKSHALPWSVIYLALSNETQVHMVWFDQFVHVGYVEQNNKVYKIAPHEVSYTVQGSENQRLHFSAPNFELEWDNETVSGTWHGSQVKGFGFVWSPAKQYQHDQRQYYKLETQNTEEDTATLAYLVWLIPVIFIVALVALIGYLGWNHQIFRPKAAKP